MYQQMPYDRLYPHNFLLVNVCSGMQILRNIAEFMLFLYVLKMTSVFYII